jgi:hypothetical protein
MGTSLTLALYSNQGMRSNSDVGGALERQLEQVQSADETDVAD